MNDCYFCIRTINEKPQSTPILSYINNNIHIKRMERMCFLMNTVKKRSSFTFLRDCLVVRRSKSYCWGFVTNQLRYVNDRNRECHAVWNQRCSNTTVLGGISESQLISRSISWTLGPTSKLGSVMSLSNMIIFVK